MAICDECTAIAEENRYLFDSAPRTVTELGFDEHPSGCGCPCQHRNPQQWEKMFSVEPPYVP